MTQPERHWYIAQSMADRWVALLGPIKGGEAAAVGLMETMLATEQAMVDAVDWEHPALMTPNPQFDSLQVIDLSVEEIGAAFKESSA